MHKPVRGLQDDPLSAASIGLLALGIDRSRRAEALELLGAMLDLADDHGDVLLDGALFAVEQRMGVEPCIEIYGWLETIDVVRRTGSGWTIPLFATHAGPVGDTAASIAVLRRHLDSIGSGSVVIPESAPVISPHRWRRAVPLAAAGIAASIAVVTGVSQMIPQAAVSGRNAALHADLPAAAARRSAAESRQNVPGVTEGSTTSPAAGGDIAANVGVSPTTTRAVEGVALACAAPKLISSITSVNLAHLAFAGENGESIWAAVVTGTTTLTDATAGIVSPALSVVAHVVDGDTDPVFATLDAPVLLANVPTAFTAIVALGTEEPTAPVTASVASRVVDTCE